MIIFRASSVNIFVIIYAVTFEHKESKKTAEGAKIIEKTTLKISHQKASVHLHRLIHASKLIFPFTDHFSCFLRKEIMPSYNMWSCDHVSENQPSHDA